jgi:hypothetical protein
MGITWKGIETAKLVSPSQGFWPLLSSLPGNVIGCQTLKK